MMKLSRYIFLIFNVIQLISQFYINAQSTQQILNITLISSTAQSSTNNMNQTISPSLTTAPLTSIRNNMNLSTSTVSNMNASLSSMIIITRIIPSSNVTNIMSTLTNTGQTASYTSQSSPARFDTTRSSSSISTNSPRPTSVGMNTVTSQQMKTTSLRNCATKYEQHIILCILVHFLLFIFPFH
ncbi:hypothetical protein I4U23_018548 [Adineta vaga]|nr:hypothetical protein I4U23_018548 [Adineta vaga]